jgi:chromate reductase
MPSTLHVLGIAGSLRARSHNKALLHAAAELAPAGMLIEIFDLGEIPLYNADIEAAGLPVSVELFRGRIAAADALLIATPEYNYSISGVLKNALDWASRPPNSPLTGKPAAILGAGGRLGTARAQYHLRQILLHNEVTAVIKPEVFIIRAGEHFDADGRLINDESRQQLQALLAALADLTHRRRAGG